MWLATSPSSLPQQPLARNNAVLNANATKKNAVYTRSKPTSTNTHTQVHEAAVATSKSVQQEPEFRGVIQHVRGEAPQ